MIQLSCPTTVLTIDRIDERVLTECYFSRCFECPLCHDDCCSYGCPVTLQEIDRILVFKDELERQTPLPVSEWFIDDVEPRDGYLSDIIKRTRVVNGSCVFHDNEARGCRLHRLALEKGFDPHTIKPLVCFLFPVTWDNTTLYISEFLEELPCRHIGTPVLDSQLEELTYYLGEAFIDEVNRLRQDMARKTA